MLHGTNRTGIWKTITVRKLKELLDRLDDDDFLECNYLGNILIFSGHQSDIENAQGIGYIDVATEKITE